MLKCRILWKPAVTEGEGERRRAASISINARQGREAGGRTRGQLELDHFPCSCGETTGAKSTSKLPIRSIGV